MNLRIKSRELHKLAFCQSVSFKNSSSALCVHRVYKKNKAILGNKTNIKLATSMYKLSRSLIQLLFFFPIILTPDSILR